MRQALTSIVLIGVTLLFVQWLVHEISPAQPLTLRDYLATFAAAIVGSALAKSLGRNRDSS